MSQVVKERLLADLDASEISFSSGTFTLKEPLLEGINPEFPYDLKAKSITLTPHFSLKKLQIRLDLSLTEPKLTVLKDGPFTLPKFDKNENILLQIYIENGDVQLMDHQEMVSHFTITSHKKFNNQYHISFSETSSLFLSRNILHRFWDMDSASLEIADLYQAVTFFSPEIKDQVREIKGNIQGHFHLDLSNVTPSYQQRLEFTDFECSLDDYQIGGEKLLVECADSHCNEKDSSLISLLIGESFRNTRMHSKFEGITLNSKSQNTFSNVNGFLSYNPGVGPKFQIEGLASSGRAFELDGRGFFYSKISNWFDTDLKFIDQNKEVSSHLFFKAYEKENDIEFVFDLKEMNFDELESFQTAISPLYPLVASVVLNEGVINVDGKLTLSDKSVTNLSISHLAAKSFGIDVPSHYLKVNLGSIMGNCSLDFEGKLLLDSLDTAFRVEKGSFHIDPGNGRVWRVDDLSNQLSIVKGNILPSHIDCLLNGLKSHMELSGPIMEVSVRNMFYGKVGSLAGLFTEKSLHRDLANQDFSGMISYKREKEKAALFGNVQIEEGEDVFDTAAFGLHLLNYDLIQSLLIEEPLSEISHGWVRGKNISLSKISSFFKPLDVDLKGNIDLASEYQGDKITFYAKGSDIELDHPHLRFQVAKLGEDSVHLFDRNSAVVSYDFSNNFWDMDIGLKNALFHVPAFDLDLMGQTCDLKMRKNFLEASFESLSSEDVDFVGKLFADFRKDFKLDLLTEKVTGSVDAVKRLASHFGADFDLDLTGVIESDQDGFYLSTTLKDDTVWGFDASLKEAEMSLTQTCKIASVQSRVSFHSEDQEIKLTDSEGELYLTNAEGSKSYHMRLPNFDVKLGESCSFDFRLEDSLWDVMRLCGECHFQEGAKSFYFDPEKTEFFGSKLNVSSCVLSSNFELASLNMEPTLQLQNCLEIGQFLLDIGITPITNIALTPLKELGVDGEIALSLNLSKDTADLRLIGKDFLIHDHAFKDVQIAAVKKSNVWEVTEFALDDWKSAFTIEMLENQWNLSGLSNNYLNSLSADMVIKYQNDGLFSIDVGNLNFDLSHLSVLFHDPKVKEIKGMVNGNGFCQVQFPFSEKEWFVEADFDVLPSSVSYKHMDFMTNAPLTLSYSTKLGVLAKGFDLMMNNSKLGLEGFHFDIGKIIFSKENENWRFKNSKFLMPVNFYSILEKKLSKDFQPLLGFLKKSVMLDQDTEILADVSFDKDSILLEVKESEFPINGASQKLKNLLFAYLPDGCEWECKFSYQDEDYWTKGNVDFRDTPKGTLIFEDEFLDEKVMPLTIQWKWEKDNLHIKDMQGEFCGIDASLHEDETPLTLSGTMKVDLNRTANLLPENIQQKIARFGLGDGYELRGKTYLDPANKNFGFQGIFSGKSFEMLGYEFKTLMSKLDFDKTHFHMKELKISDTSGILKIDQILCDNEEGEWLLSIPSIRLKEFRPSLMKEVGKEPAEIEPLVVRNLDINNLSGNLHDSDSFTGKGNLNFINSFKREHTVFDIPADFLGRIFGLDLELLIPVIGEIDFEIEEGKAVLTDLKESFSQNRRSKFFLFEKNEAPYMDFDGNLNVNIKMKQFVLFKITEHFIIKINGSLMNPTFSLKRKKSFFSS